jgi:hypothetical protein
MKTRTDEEKRVAAEYMRLWRLRQSPETIAAINERNRLQRLGARLNPERRLNDNAKVRARRKLMSQNVEWRANQTRVSTGCIKRVRDRILSAYGARCKCCGETEPMFLEIDHVNGGGAKHFKSKWVSGVYREIVAAGCPPDYRILCANCNKGRHRNGGTCPHGNGI